MIRVLHDWDKPFRNRLWFLRRSLQLFWYFLRGNRRYVRDHAVTLAKLDNLVGVESHFGLRLKVSRKFPDVWNDLQKLGATVHLHEHDDSQDDDSLRRRWTPPLSQRRETWLYDRDFVRGNPPPLESGELPIFHVDRPHYLPHYIDFLHRIKRGWNPYEG